MEYNIPMKLVANLLIRMFILLLTTTIVPGFHINSYITAFWVAIVLAILNTLLKPVLVLLTLPITILTLGLFALIINALLLLLASSFVKGFQIDSFMTALVAAIVISILSAILNSVMK
jgi:putative membrane protein